jgi:hypothetical protein
LAVESYFFITIENNASPEEWERKRKGRKRYTGYEFDGVEPIW